MLSEAIAEMELENRRLKELLQLAYEDAPKPKQCKNCRYYIQHYGKNPFGTYFKVAFGHCTCGIPIKKRGGRKQPTPEETCMCFEERTCHKFITQL